MVAMCREKWITETHNGHKYKDIRAVILAVLHIFKQIYTDTIFLKGVLEVDFLEHKQIIWENLSFSNKIGNILLLKLLKRNGSKEM